MRTLLILITVCLAMLLGSASPIGPKHIIDSRRSPGHQYAVKRGPVKSLTTQNPEFNLRKGEYIRDNKVQKLHPGEIPKNCPEGLCQYPV